MVAAVDLAKKPENKGKLIVSLCSADCFPKSVVECAHCVPACAAQAGRATSSTPTLTPHPRQHVQTVIIPSFGERYLSSVLFNELRDEAEKMQHE